MNINFENIPAVVFDWIETMDYSALSAAQRTEVDRWFSQQDYEELYRVSRELKQLSSVEYTPKEKIKHNLLEQFDAHQGNKRNTGYSPKQIFWQAAAVFLFMLCGWLFYQVFDLRSQHGINQMAVTDTVYVDREVKSNPEIIHDTIYKYFERKQEKKSHSHSTGEAAEEERMDVFHETEIPPVLELENLSKTRRGNSMKDDTLLKKFGFVAM